MSIRDLGTYDDMDVWLAVRIEDFINAVRDGELPKGLSIALITDRCADRCGSDEAIVADILPSLCPTLVHCFGSNAEMLHDAVDSALWKRGQEGIQTYWTTEWEPAEVIFDFFVTDLPGEDDLERWTGRLMILDELVTHRKRDALLSCLKEVDATIQAYDDGD